MAYAKEYGFAATKQAAGARTIRAGAPEATGSLAKPAPIENADDIRQQLIELQQQLQSIADKLSAMIVELS